MRYFVAGLLIGILLNNVEPKRGVISCSVDGLTAKYITFRVDNMELMEVLTIINDGLCKKIYKTT